LLWPNRHKIHTWRFALRNHRKLGEPCETDIVLDRAGYSLGFSYKRMCALWVSYTISKGSVGVDVDRGIRFYADPEVPEKYRVRPEDFTNTGYDKGHLAPSAAIDFSLKSNSETFAMTNIALQHPKLNRQAWGRLEGIIRGWTRTKGKLSVVTGPLYGQRSRRINGIPVPRRFYKVVYSFRHKAFIGFIIPNTEVKANEIWNYAMSVRDVEKETGHKFFSELNKKKQRAKRKIDLEWWKGRKG
ncbi:DNA/RNA non-specific endonuclease, partial [Desulfobacterales bacterium HSG2]|nr:DNA/RNA non-specific endonuclease [Desulfobacterales bacterium HSG2]